MKPPLLVAGATVALLTVIIAEVEAAVADTTIATVEVDTMIVVVEVEAGMIAAEEDTMGGVVVADPSATVAPPTAQLPDLLPHRTLVGLTSTLVEEVAAGMTIVVQGVVGVATLNRVASISAGFMVT